MTMALFASRPSEHVALLGSAGRILFFILNCVNVLVCAAAVWQRRHRLRATLWPFLPSWASLTFPLVSSCTVAETYAIDLRIAAATGNASAAAAFASANFARALVALTLVVIPLIDLMWICQLPSWFFRAPPAPNDSDDDEAERDKGSKRMPRAACLAEPQSESADAEAGLGPVDAGD